MGRFGTRGWLIGALIVGAIAVVSASAFVFQGRDDGSSGDARATGADRVSAASTTTSSTTTTSTTTTTTTQPPSPPPTAPPSPVEAVPPPPAPAPVCDGGGSGVIDAMNADRGVAGVAPLCSSSQLAGYAQSWAEWMAQHQSLSHQDLATVLAGTSFTTVGENILSGPGSMSVGEMEAAWMASPGHRQNILSGGYGAAGVGTAFSSDGRVWVAVEFGG